MLLLKPISQTYFGEVHILIGFCGVFIMSVIQGDQKVSVHLMITEVRCTERFEHPLVT
jgi:hypothetical protein